MASFRLLLSFLLLPAFLIGQNCFPEPGNSPCSAPVLCTGSPTGGGGAYCAYTNPQTTSVIPPIFCPNVFYVQWLSFVATSQFLSLDLTALNCSGVPPIFQMQLYQSASNCELVDSLIPIYCCDCAGGAITTGQLIPGQLYYLAIGNHLDITCQYTIYGLSIIPDVVYITSSSLCSPDTATAGNCQQVCANSTVTYTAISNDFVNWEVSGADSYDVLGNQVTVHWGDPGSGFVTAIPTGSGNTFCSSPNTQCVLILPNPDAQISTDPPSNNGQLTVCKGQSITFTSQSTNTEYLSWDFGDNILSDQIVTTHAYNTPGDYLVTLIARNLCFCTDTTYLQIHVLNSESPEITCTGTICEGETVTYYADASCGGYAWSVSSNGTIVDGGTSGDSFITIQWNTGPSGTVSLTVNNCSSGAYCLTPAVATIPILSENVQIDGPDKVCNNSTTTYTIPDYQGSTINWNVSTNGTLLEGQGTSKIKVKWTGTPPANNPNWVAVSIDNCFLSCNAKDTLVVNLLEDFYIKGEPQVCENSTSTYQTSTSVSNNSVSCDWIVKAEDGTIEWLSPGPAGSVNVNWNFGPGKYTLEANPINPNQVCNAPYQFTITVESAPSVVSNVDGATQICPGNAYTYTATGSAGNRFQWTVHNGASNTTLDGNPVNITWGNTGPYQLSVVQISSHGLPCPSLPLAVSIAPITTFTLSGPAQGCLNAKSHFIATSIPQTDYQWSILPADAGDITGDPGNNEVDIYWYKTGPVTVQATICGHTESFLVNVNPLPFPIAQYPAQLCAGQTGVVQTSVPYSAYIWVDDNGVVVSNIATPSLIAGSYAVNVTDGNGCINNTSFTIEELPNPVASISTPDHTHFCNGAPVPTLYALESSPGLSYNWVVNANPIGNNASTLTSATYGSYYVEVTDPNGCTANSNIIYLVDQCDPNGPGNNPGGPVTNCPPGTLYTFTSNNTAECNRVQFINTSLDYVLSTLHWDFDDPGSGVNNTSSLSSLDHVFSKAGFFSVLLYGSTTGGQICWDTHVITIPAAADFYAPSGCPGATLSFEDRSTFLPGNSVASLSWDFGDPASGATNTSALPNPQHTFTNPGIYNVTLVITSNTGCTSQITRPIEIHALPSLTFIPPILHCEGTALIFQAQTSPDVSSVAWNFGDPGSLDANTSVTAESYHIFDNQGTYNTTLTGTSVYGCSNSFSDQVNVQPNNLSGVIVATPPPPLCEGSTTTLSSPPGGAVFAWTTAETTSSIIVGESGIFDVTITDSEGCNYSPPVLTVNVIPAPAGTIRAIEFNEYGQPINYVYNNYDVCDGEDVVLEIISNGNNSYQWNDGNFSNTVYYTSDHGTLLSVGVHNYSVTVTNNTTGCTAIVGPFQVNVHPKPAFFVIQNNPGGLNCSNTPVTFTVSSPQPGLSYQWNTGENGNSITTTLAGNYYAIAVSSFGCKTESNHIDIIQGPDIQQIPAGCLTRCNPQTICLPPIQGVTHYQWYLNGATIPAPNGTTPNLVANQSGSYTLEMTDLYGCHATSDPLNLDLYPGYGSITGHVYFDVNDNGVIDPADTIVFGSDVWLTQNGSVLDTVSSINGVYTFANILSTGYTLVLDTLSLPPVTVAYYSTVDTSMTGCDVEATVDWLIHQNCTTSSAITLNACTGSTVNYNGNLLNPGTTQSFHFILPSGCDSTVVVTVAELPTSGSTLQLEACPGETVNYNGTDLSPGQVMSFVFSNQYGCDSTVVVNVSALPVSNSTLQLVACPGETVNYNGTDLSPGQVMSFVFSNQYGCDSTVVVTVTALPVNTSSLQLGACPGETVTYNGTQLSPGQVMSFQLTNQYGCDSIVTVTVQAYPISNQTLNLNTCFNEPLVYNGVSINPGEQMTFTFTNQYGCDSIITVVVTAWPLFSFSLSSEESCNNPPNGSITVSNPNPSPGPYMYSLDGAIYQPENVFSGLSPGNYTVYVMDAHDCVESNQTSVAEIPSIDAIPQTVIFPCEADTLIIQPILNDPIPDGLHYVWNNGDTMSFLVITAPGTYTVQISNSCESITNTIEVIPEIPGGASFIYIPNVFSPDGNLLNDEFKAYFSANAQISNFSLEVFDRWGNLMFQTNNPDIGWNGKYKGKKLTPGVFAYMVDGEVNICNKKVKVHKFGDVTILR